MGDELDHVGAITNNHEWSPEQRIIIIQLWRRGNVRRHLHEKDYYRFQYIGTLLNIPIIIGSSIAGSISALGLQADLGAAEVKPGCEDDAAAKGKTNTTYIMIALAVLNCLIAIISGLTQFSRVTSRAENNLHAVSAYDRVATGLEMEIYFSDKTHMKPAAQLISATEKELTELHTISPPLSAKTRAWFRRGVISGKLNYDTYSSTTSKYMPRTPPADIFFMGWTDLQAIEKKLRNPDQPSLRGDKRIGTTLRKFISSMFKRSTDGQSRRGGGDHRSDVATQDDGRRGGGGHFSGVDSIGRRGIPTHVGASDDGVSINYINRAMSLDTIPSAVDILQQSETQSVMSPHRQPYVRPPPRVGYPHQVMAPIRPVVPQSSASVADVVAAATAAAATNSLPGPTPPPTAHRPSVAEPHPADPLPRQSVVNPPPPS